MTYSTWYHHVSLNNEIFSSQLWIYLKLERGGGYVLEKHFNVYFRNACNFSHVFQVIVGSCTLGYLWQRRITQNANKQMP